MSRDDKAERHLRKAERALSKIGGKTVERHIFLCALSEKQKCCSRDEGKAAWSFLKTRLKQLKLAGPSKGEGPDATGGVQRTKADLVSFLHADHARTHHSGASDRRRSGGGVPPARPRLAGGTDSNLFQG